MESTGMKIGMLHGDAMEELREHNIKWHPSVVVLGIGWDGIKQAAEEGRVHLVLLPPKEDE